MKETLSLAFWIILLYIMRTGRHYFTIYQISFGIALFLRSGEWIFSVGPAKRWFIDDILFSNDLPFLVHDELCVDNN